MGNLNVERLNNDTVEITSEGDKVYKSIDFILLCLTIFIVYLFFNLGIFITKVFPSPLDGHRFWMFGLSGFFLAYSILSFVRSSNRPAYLVGKTLQINMASREVHIQEKFIRYPKSSMIYIKYVRNYEDEGPMHLWHFSIGTVHHRILLLSHSGNEKPNPTVNSFASKLKQELSMEVNYIEEDNREIFSNNEKKTQINRKTNEEPLKHHPPIVNDNFINTIRKGNSTSIFYHQDYPKKVKIHLTFKSISLMLALILFDLGFGWSASFIGPFTSLLNLPWFFRYSLDFLVLSIGFYIAAEIVVRKISDIEMKFSSKGFIFLRKGIFTEKKFSVKSSNFKNWIIKEDSKNIIIEFTYKGYEFSTSIRQTNKTTHAELITNIIRYYKD
jgi:hypothetical protein